MQKNRTLTKLCLALAIGLLTASIAAVINLTATKSLAFSAGHVNQTAGQMISGSITGTNTTSICTPHYPC
ncbi:MAG TPA: hypothetical protein VFI73_05080 [Candidatus Nitrosopolaris sp.]|nr:hypothetical protein [Candidatus Nitrosopolaris sp.]